MGCIVVGVWGISLNEDGKDIVVGMVIIDLEEVEIVIMVFFEKGMGKCMLYSDYCLINCGGKGVKNM